MGGRCPSCTRWLPAPQISGAGTFDDIRFNGQSNEENAIRFDGIEGGGIMSNNPGDFNGEVTGVFRLQASLENVQELGVDSNNNPAEFGTGGGGQIKRDHQKRGERLPRQPV